MSLIQINDTLFIDESEITEEFVQASGPGGQNVNKVATAVQLRFDIANSPSLPKAVKARLLGASDRRINQDGVLLLTSARYRTQHQNRQDVLDKLIALILNATRVPKTRRETKPGAQAKARRLDEKRKRSSLKQSRKPVSQDD